jgi:EAL domain-containing protein (putative c-di-GMP-specific phosphodiesterase class I)
VTLLDELLTPEALTTVFQPIVALGANGSRTIHGYEALTRGPRGTHASRADVLFEYVRRKRAEAVIDRVCALSALRAARGLPGTPSISINVHAATLGQDEGFCHLLVDTAEACGIGAERLVVEVVEQSSHWNSAALARGLAELRSAGAKVALDDVGFGHSNLQMVIELRPDLLKLDRYFVVGAAKDPARRAVFSALQHLAHALGARVVAEGVETAEDLAVVLEAGITLAQGYLFSPPLAVAALHASHSARPSAVLSPV